MRTLLLALLLALLAAGAFWLLRGASGRGAEDASESRATREFDVAVMEVADALLVVGPPDDHPCSPDLTAAAVAGFAQRLPASGFGPAMRRGTVPRATVAVAGLVPFEQRRSANAPAADCAIYLALERFELLEWNPPSATGPGRASFSAQGRVWVHLPADGSTRVFFGDFTGRHETAFGTDELAGAPADPELAAAFLFGRRLLETWRRGLMWREAL